MSDGLRDYVAWHRDYDDPESELSHRLREVQQIVDEALDRTPGPLRVVSACAGDGRDVLGVLAARADRDRVAVTLIEIEPVLAAAARHRAVGHTRVEVRCADAGRTDAYAGAVPADLLLLVGIFGNITPSDIERTVRTVPQLCAPGATVVWSRGAGDPELNGRIRGWFTDVGCVELETRYLRADGSRVLGVVRFDGAPEPLRPGEALFTFVR